MPRVENRACNAFMAAAAIAKTDLPTINYDGKICFQAFLKRLPGFSTVFHRHKNVKHELIKVI